MTGEEFRELRRKTGLNQRQLGERLGIPTNTIARWERGEVGIRHGGLVRLAMLHLQEDPSRPPPLTWPSSRS